jgi:chemotaxis protein MotD
VFSVTPEPAISKPAYDPQARQARADQPPSDDFAAMVDSSETDRPPARPAPDAPRREARATDAPPPGNDRPQADASSNNESGPAKKDADSSTASDATAAGDKSGKTKTASGDSKADDKPQNDNGEDDAAATAVTLAIPAIVTDPVAVVIAAAAAPVATGDDTASTTTVAAAAVASASVVTAPVDASATKTPGVAEEAASGATVTTAATPPAADTPAPETAAATISAAATVIKSDSGKTEVVAKDGEAAHAKDAKDSKQATDASAKPVSDQAIKPETGAANADDKPAEHQQASSESGKTETEKHTGKAAPKSEHHTAAPAPQVLTDPGLQPPGGIQPQPIQTHAANLTAVAVPAANTALADSVPVPLNGLAADIALRAAGGNSRFEIRLDPAELGRIDVRLDVDKHGNVTSHLTVERPATLDMLRRDAPQLQQALEDAGLKTGDSGLQFSLRDQSSSGQNNDNGSGRNSRRVVIGEEDTVPAQVAGRTYGRMLGASSGVDIRI